MDTLKRIVVIDDDPTVTNLLKAKLEATGRFEVRVTNDSRDADILAAQFRPDLVVCDINMPEMDGGDVYHTFSQSPRLEGVPFLFLSSIVPKSVVEQNQGVVGGKQMISKKSSLEEILDRIEAMAG